MSVERNQFVLVEDRPEWGVGEVVRVQEIGGAVQADVVFGDGDARRVETVLAERLKACLGLWERLDVGQFDSPLDFLLKQLAYQFPLQNAGGELSNSRTQLLPHQNPAHSQCCECSSPPIVGGG